jgi:DNA-binding MarR family transcriptional regulator
MRVRVLPQNECARARPDIFVCVQASNSQQLAEDIHWLTGELLRRNGGSALALVEENELSPSQLKALLSLARETAPISVGDLATALVISLPSASRAADALCRRGFVARCVCARDHRARDLSLSAEGRLFFESLNTARVNDIKVFTDTLNAVERAKLAAALVGLTHHLRS